MPVSVANSRLIFDALKACDVRVMSALPETWLVHLIRMADDDPDTTLVRLAKEEEGVGISMGAHLAGVRSAMLMQNHGFLASVNGIVSGAQLYRIPLLMLISDRGRFGERDPWQTEGGGVTEPVLQALRISYERLDQPARVAPQVRQAITLAYASLRPVANRLQLGRDRSHDRHDNRLLDLRVDRRQCVESPHQSSHMRSRHRSSATGLLAASASVCALAMRWAT